MKMFLIAAAFVAACICLASAVHADAYQAPSFKRPPPPDMIQTDLADVGAKIAREYIEAQGWCNMPEPQPAQGVIAVYYQRDEDGRCTPHAKVGE